MLFEEREMAVSSAYMLTCDFCMQNGKKLMYIRNKSGPSLEELHNLFLSHQRKWCDLPCRIVYCYLIQVWHDEPGMFQASHSIQFQFFSVGFHDQPYRKPSSSQLELDQCFIFKYQSLVLARRAVSTECKGMAKLGDMSFGTLLHVTCPLDVSQFSHLGNFVVWNGYSTLVLAAVFKLRYLVSVWFHHIIL